MLRNCRNEQKHLLINNKRLLIRTQLWNATRAIPYKDTNQLIFHEETTKTSSEASKVEAGNLHEDRLLSHLGSPCLPNRVSGAP